VTALANEIRAAGKPLYCSACFTWKEDGRYIDFDAACDRGYGNQEAVKVAMDDLILCETCLKHAAGMVDMIDATTQAEHIGSLERRLADEQARCEQAVGYANRMEEALARRPEPIKVSRPRGRPPKNTRQPVTVGA
jgi:hypothetical protein